MASSKRKVEDAFKAHQALPIRLHDFAGEGNEAAFDLITTDTFIAGVATSLIDGVDVAPEHRKIVWTSFLAESLYRLSDGRVIDLAPYPALLMFARSLDRLRRVCEEAVSD
jgi:hypothetical protein